MFIGRRGIPNLDGAGGHPHSGVSRRRAHPRLVLSDGGLSAGLRRHRRARPGRGRRSHVPRGDRDQLPESGRNRSWQHWRILRREHLQQAGSAQRLRGAEVDDRNDSATSRSRDRAAPTFRRCRSSASKRSRLVISRSTSKRSRECQDANTLTLSGRGHFNWTGYDRTHGTFEFTGTNSEGSIAFVASDAAPVPEPASLVLMASGAAMGLGRLRRRGSQSRP